MKHLISLTSALFVAFAQSQAAADPSIYQSLPWKGLRGTHVIADLDETLIDSTPRKYFAYRQVVRSGAMRGLSLLDFYAIPNRYDLVTLLKLQSNPTRSPFCDRSDEEGCADDYEIPKLVTKILERYQSPSNLALDSIIPGADALIQRLRNSGATVWFVSSRSAATLAHATIQSLVNLQLIPNPSAAEAFFVRLQPEGVSSLDFKRSTTLMIQEFARRNGSRVSIILENEPENLDVMLQAAPEAKGYLIQGAAVKPEHPVPAEVVRLNDLL